MADELTAQGQVMPRYHESATILFADFKDFTRLTEALDPASLVEQLNHNFARFDEVAGCSRLEPLKTIGDAYMCAGGLPEPNRTHAIDACHAALQMQKFVKDANRQRQQLRLEPGRVNISGSTLHHVAALFETEPRGKVAVKHMDALEMYFLDRIKPDLAADAAGCLPNERFWQASGLA